MNHIVRIVPLLFVVSLVAGCPRFDIPSLLATEGQPADEAIPLAQVPGIEQILAAPEVVQIGERNWSLEPWLWRSYGFGDPNGSPLWGWIGLASDAEVQIAAGFVVTEVIVILEQKDAWVVAPDSWEAGTVEISGGPRWRVGARIDIAVRIEETDGTNHWLMAREQTIFSDHPTFIVPH